MKQTRYNLLLILLVVLITAAPLLGVHKGNEGNEVEMFTGADGQAVDVIQEISPGYEQWFTPLWEPSSSEIESLLFALQAALGAGFIGYYLGFSRSKAKGRPDAAH